MLRIILGIAGSYLIGSIPTGYLFARILRGIDIRQFGSGNVGATNVMRCVGLGPGLLVLALDALKGYACVSGVASAVFSRSVPLAEEPLRVILGVAAIAGHNWTLFLGFKGGKGVATTLGVLIGLAVVVPGFARVLGATLGFWCLVFVSSRIVSLSSLVAAVALPVCAFIFRVSVFLQVTCLLLCVFVVLRHLPNIARLRQGTEKRITFKKNR